MLPCSRERTFPAEPVEALTFSLRVESESSTTPEIAFPTGYMVPPLSAVPIVRIFNESDAAPVWPCGGAEAFPHPPSARPVQRRNKEIMCENLCMKISYSLCVQAVKPEKAPDSFCNFTSLEYNIKSVADTMYFRKTNKNRSERGDLRPEKRVIQMRNQ